MPNTNEWGYTFNAEVAKANKFQRYEFEREFWYDGELKETRTVEFYARNIIRAYKVVERWNRTALLGSSKSIFWVYRLK